MGNSKVLFIDDDIEILEMLKRCLIDDFDILTAISGSEGIELLKKDNSIAIIFCDLLMPKMNGIEVLNYAYINNPEVKRILVTGASKMKIILSDEKYSNIDNFMFKPFSMEYFSSVIKELL